MKKTVRQIIEKALMELADKHGIMIDEIKADWTWMFDAYGKPVVKQGASIKSIELKVRT